MPCRPLQAIRRPIHAFQLLVTLLATCVLLSGCGSGHHGPFRFFSSASFWNQPISASAAIDPGSGRMVSTLDTIVQSEIRAKNGPWIDAGTNGVPIVIVSGKQPTVPVTLDRPGPADAEISAAWHSVPLPANAQPSPGEHDLAVWQPSTNRMWEFYELGRADGRWEARWGGAMQHVSTDAGVYRPGVWPGAQSFWGVTASSLPLVGGAMTIQQLQAGKIDHALAIAIPDTRSGVFATPAQRTDGRSTAVGAIPEGARLRLDPTLKLSSLHLPKLTLAMARAAQRYGIIVRDTGGNVSFFAQEPPAGSTAYEKLYGGLDPYQLLARFPWSHLQVLKLDLRPQPS